MLKNPHMSREGAIKGISVALFVCVFAAIAFAQHGDAGAGYYSFGYEGDTWTGQISALNTSTREITLTYTHKSKTENFKGVVDSNGVNLVGQDGKPIANKSLALGERITVYYIPKGRPTLVTSNGKKKYVKAQENTIFEIKFLPPQQEK